MPATWPEDAPAFDPEFEDITEKAAHDVPTDRLAVVSLVAGIAGFFLPVVGPITAIVSGHVARDEIRKSKGRLGGDGLARTGLILGYVWLLLTAVVVTGTMFTYTLRMSPSMDQVILPPVPPEVGRLHPGPHHPEMEPIGLPVAPRAVVRVQKGQGFDIIEVPVPPTPPETH